MQDNVPAFDSRQAMAIVESNLGAPISNKFEMFDPQPIAAASLGQVCSCIDFGSVVWTPITGIIITSIGRMQVHLAQINGEKVVVKIQRPGLKSLFDIDMKNVRLPCASMLLVELDPLVCPLKPTVKRPIPSCWKA